MSRISVGWFKIVELSIVIGAFLIIILFIHYVGGGTIGESIGMALILMILSWGMGYVRSSDSFYYEMKETEKGGGDAKRRKDE